MLIATDKNLLLILIYSSEEIDIFFLYYLRYSSTLVVSYPLT